MAVGDGVLRPRLRISYNGAVDLAWGARWLTIDVEDSRYTDQLPKATIVLDNSDGRFGEGAGNAISDDVKVKLEAWDDTTGTWHTTPLFWGILTDWNPDKEQISVDVMGGAFYAARRPLECWYSVAEDEDVKTFILGTTPGVNADTDGALYPEYDPSISKRLRVDGSAWTDARVLLDWADIQLACGQTWWEMLNELAKAVGHCVAIDWNGTDYMLYFEPRLYHADAATEWGTYAAAKQKTHSIKRGGSVIAVGYGPTTWGHEYLDGTNIDRVKGEILDLVEVYGDPSFAIFGMASRIKSTPPDVYFTKDDAKRMRQERRSSILSDEQAEAIAQAMIDEYGVEIRGGSIFIPGTLDIAPQDAIRFYDVTMFSAGPVYMIVASVKHKISASGWITELVLESEPGLGGSMSKWLAQARDLDVFKDPQGTVVSCLYPAGTEIVAITDTCYGVQYYDDLGGWPGVAGVILCSWTPCDDHPSPDLTDSDFYEYVIGYCRIAHPVIANDPDDYVAGTDGGKWGGAQDAFLFNMDQPATAITGLIPGFSYYLALFVHCKAGEAVANTYIRCAQIGPIVAGA